MNVPSSLFLGIYSKAIQGGTETTLRELIVSLELPSSCPVLEQIQSVQETLSSCKAELVPDLKTGSLDTNRILRSSVSPAIDAERILAEVAEGETAARESKSSLIYDHKKAAANPVISVQELKSEDVTYAALKTIAAFLTSGGGTLYAGFNDSGECIGIDFDYPLLKEGSGNRDGWELHLRNLLTGKFKDGSTINDYVRADFIDIGGRMAARLTVQRRRALSFLKRNDTCLLYRRQGNRTMEVKSEELEEFLEFRKTQGWS